MFGLRLLNRKQTRRIVGCRHAPSTVTMSVFDARCFSCPHSDLQSASRRLLDCSAMENVVVRTLCVLLFLATRLAAQDVIPLQTAAPPGSTPENYPEKEYFSRVWNTEVVANVTKPSLTVFKSPPELRNGTAVVICPGGGFMALAITSEGTEVAKYMTARGVIAFVLKYRLAHTGEDATQEFNVLDRKSVV